MKKVILIALIAFSFAGCDNKSTMSTYLQAEKFYYEDHEYIVFKSGFSIVGIEHNPECDLCNVEKQIYNE